ncbi:MAG: hypothetical protein PHN89_02025 [Candidatus Pacebacteria bacterium]|nr:hypothetical protein [Candidatus Paceibacterota bacterium]
MRQYRRSEVMRIKVPRTKRIFVALSGVHILAFVGLLLCVPIAIALIVLNAEGKPAHMSKLQGEPHTLLAQIGDTSVFEAADGTRVFVNTPGPTLRVGAQYVVKSKCYAVGNAKTNSYWLERL